MFIGKARSGGHEEVVYEDPDMLPESDPKMEKCAAYGVLSMGRLK